MQKFKLKQRNDLIKIYEAGHLKDFEEEYKLYKENLEKFYKMKERLTNTYFQDIVIDPIFPKEIKEVLQNIENMPWFDNLTPEEQNSILNADKKIEEKPLFFIENKEKEILLFQLSILENSSWFNSLSGNEKKKVLYGENVKLAYEVFDDPLFNEYVSLAKTYLGKKIERYHKKDFLEVINEKTDNNEKVLDFFLNYIAREMSPKVTYTTMYEEALEYGNQEVIDFIKRNPKDYWEIHLTTYKLLGKRLKEVRENKNMTPKELEEDTRGYLSVGRISKIESEGSFNKCVLEIYADLGETTVEELLKYQELIEMYNWKNQSHYSYKRIKYTSKFL